MNYNLDGRGKTVRLSEGCIGERLLDLRVDKDVLNMI